MFTVILPCCARDQHQAIRLLRWISELGQSKAACKLLCSEDCDIETLKELAGTAFSSVSWIKDGENINSNWGAPGNEAKSAAGPNSLFRQAAWEMFYDKAGGPWLFLEPDAIPCTPKWDELLWNEYQQAVSAGKTFMGALVSQKTHPGTRPIPDHLSGVAIYPKEMPMIAPAALSAADAAFDVVGSEDMLKHAHFTKAIFHHYRAPSFKDEQDFEARVPKHVVLFHANKDGSIIPFLRQRLNMKGGESCATLDMKHMSSEQSEGLLTSGITSSQVASPGAVKSDPEAAPIVDLFIKTYEKDAKYLEYLEASIQKFASGFRRVVIESDRLLWRSECSFDAEWIISDQKEPGYLWQQSCKLHADNHTDAEYIVYADSDLCFTRPVSLDDFFRDGKPIWLFDEIKDARPDQRNTWAPAMTKWMGKPPTHEFMRRHCFIVPRDLLPKLRDFCLYRHGMTLKDYIMSQAVPGNPLALTFSEWNCAGMFFYEFHRERFAWLKPEEVKPYTYQGFSHGGEKRFKEDVETYEAILNPPKGWVVNPEWIAEGPDKIIVNNDPRAFIKLSDGRHAIQGEPEGGSSLICPIETSAVGTPELTIASCIDFLVKEAHRDGFAKGRILKQLRVAGLEKGKSLRALPKPKKVIKNPRPPLLMCIQSYPGGTDAVKRHWSHFQTAGASRIVGIGTMGGGRQFPLSIDQEEIGENKYISGDHLPQRLIDTLEFCLKQPEDHYCVVEYDVLFFAPIPAFSGFYAHKTGGQLPDAKATSFHHNPWFIDRPTAIRLLPEMREIIREGHCQHRWPEASPDVFIAYARERVGLPAQELMTQFTRNSLDIPGDLELACEAVEKGVQVVHGVKKVEELKAIERALKRRVKSGR